MSDEELRGPLTSPVGSCARCQYGEHACACGEALNHGTFRCGRCKAALANGYGW